MATTTAPAKDSTANAKLVQYLTEAYGKEKELETALQAHIELAQKPAYEKRLKEHLKETKQHTKLVERRLKKLGGGGITKELASLTSKGLAVAKGPLHAMRGASPEEKQLKNAKTELSEEHEEIATYLAIETLAEAVGDTETAKVAKQIRKEEERMAAFLLKQIPLLTKDVAKAEIPAAERNGSSAGKRRSSSRRASASRSSSSRQSTAKSKATKAAKPAASAAKSTKSKAKGAATRTKSAAKSTTNKSTGRSRGSSTKRSSSSSRKRSATRS